MTNWQPGMRITAARLNDGIDVTTTGTGMTAPTGWQINSFVGLKSGRVVTLDFVVRNTGQNITPGSDGNIADRTIATVPSGWRPTSGTTACFWDSGIANGGCVLNTDGTVVIRTMNSAVIKGDADTDNPGAGSNLAFHVSFLLT